MWNAKERYGNAGTLVNIENMAWRSAFRKNAQGALKKIRPGTTDFLIIDIKKTKKQKNKKRVIVI